MSKGSGDRVTDKPRFDQNYEGIDWDEGWNGLRPYGITAPLKTTTVTVVQSVCNQRCPDPVYCMRNGCMREEDG